MKARTADLCIEMLDDCFVKICARLHMSKRRPFTFHYGFLSRGGACVIGNFGMASDSSRLPAPGALGW